MRSLLIASASVSLLAAGAADAQRMVVQGPGASYPEPGLSAPMAPRPPMAPRAMPAPPMGGHAPRWGNKIGDRWSGGVNAPGGYGGYRQPFRGWALPSYWLSPGFVISDWSDYGLSQPPYGYQWSRYYDDAVLIDARGSVYDTVGDVDWDGNGGDARYADDYRDDDRVYAGSDDRHYAPPPRYERRDNGVGGAVTGAVVGGVAGNLIGGRGNRLGGTLIGAGVGAAAGYAIDRHEDDRRGPPPPPRGYGADYPPPPPPRFLGEQGRTWVSPDGGTRVVTTSGGYGGGTTVVTVQTAPVVTTTTEVYEDTVTYSRPHKVYRKHVWHPRPKCGCR